MSETATKPPKPRKPRKPRVGSDATKGRLIKLWQVGFYAFAIATSVILVGATIASFARGNIPRVGMAASVFVIGLSWSVLRAKNATFVDPEGVKASDVEPEFRDFVNSIAAAVGADAPTEIDLVVGAEIDLRESTRHFGRTVDRSILVVGLPFVQAFSKRELATLLAHQLAHHAKSDVHEGPRAIRSLREARQLIATERAGFVNVVYGSYARKMYRSVGGVAVAQEEAADRLTARAYGTKALLSALARVDDVVVAFDQMLRDYLVPAMQSEAHPRRFYDGFGELLKSATRSADRAKDLKWREARVRDDFDLHQYPPERIAMIESWPVEAGTVDLEDGDAPATSLLDPEAKSMEIAIATWTLQVLGTQTAPMEWPELTEEIYSAPPHILAKQVFADDVEPAGQLEQTLTWAADNDWSTADEALTSTLEKRESLDDKRAEWVRAVVVEAAAATDQFHWEASWDGPPPLKHNDGSVFDPDPIADLILAGDTSAAQAAFDACL